MEWNNDFGRFNALGTILLTVLAVMSSFAGLGNADEAEIIDFVPAFLTLFVLCGGSLMFLERRRDRDRAALPPKPGRRQLEE